MFVRPNGDDLEAQPAKHVLERVSEHCAIQQALSIASVWDFLVIQTMTWSDQKGTIILM